jgi:hypothetical protein
MTVLIADTIPVKTTVGEFKNNFHHQSQNRRFAMHTIPMADSVMNTL